MFIKNRLVVAVIAATSVTAQAEDTPPPSSTLMKQVTVTATRTEKAVNEVAGSVSVINAEQIEKQMASNVEELLRYEPGVTTQGNGRLGMQGFNIRGMSGNRVKVMVDGVKITSTYQSGSDYLRPEQDYVDVDSLKSVEIVKGPGSTLYGSDAMGGVVAFVTKSPADLLKAEGDDSYFSAKAAYSGADTGFAETLSFANRIGQLETMLIVTRRDNKETDTHSGDDIQGVGRGKEESLDSGLNNVLAEARYQLNDEQTIGVKADWLDQSSKSELEASADGRDYSKDQRERQRVTLFYDWNADYRWFDSVKTQLTWQNTKSNQVTYTYGSAYLGDRKKDYFYEQGGYQLGSQFNKSLVLGSSKHLLTYGLSLQKGELENNNKTSSIETGIPVEPDDGLQPGRYSPLATSENYGLFFQDEITLANGSITLTPGVRYDSFKLSPETDNRYTKQLEDNKGDAFTAKLGALYRATDEVTLFAVYSQGFRAPTLDEAYYAYENAAHGYAYLGNPDLKPEESDSYELGIRFEGYAGAFEVTAFRNDYKNFIEEVSMAGSGGTEYQKQNIAKANVEGVEMRGELWLDEAYGAPRGLSLNGAIAYANGTNEETGKPLESIAPLTGVIGLNYDHRSRQYGGSLSLTLVAAKDSGDIGNDERFEAPGYGVLDLTTYYQPTPKLTLRAGLFNLADKQYWQWEDIRGLSKSGRAPLPESGLDRYAQPGRHFSISGKYIF